MRRSKTMVALIGLNAFLLAALAWKVSGGGVAHAQAGGRGDYMMVPARITGFNNGVIFLLDSRNGVLSAFSYDNNRKTLDTMQPIPLGRLFDNANGVGNPNRVNPRRP